MINAALMCMTLAIYYESRDQPLIGQLGVATVVLERVNDPAYPNTECEVINQGPLNGGPTFNRCQFSFMCDGKKEVMRNQTAALIALGVALLSYTGVGVMVTHHATHYHEKTILPWWALSMTRTADIADHYFYKKQG